jgi:hypothetical protein
MERTMRLKVGGMRVLRWLLRFVGGGCVVVLQLSKTEGGCWLDIYSDEIGPPFVAFPGDPRKGLWNGMGALWIVEIDVLAAP